MSNPALEIENISFAYGKQQVLSDINLSIHAGETCVLLGPNGAGKSTLFSLICGLFTSTIGHIKILGNDVATQSQLAMAPLGVVFQAQTLDLDLTVYQNLRYFCALRGFGKKTANARIDAALDQLDLKDRRKVKIRELNGGHRRRVELARATLHEPDILLLDEPTVGLDIPTRRALIDQLHQLASSNNTAILWATHLVDEVQASDRVVIMSRGAISADGNPAALIEQSNSDNLEHAFQVLAS